MIQKILLEYPKELTMLLHFWPLLYFLVFIVLGLATRVVVVPIIIVTGTGYFFGAS